MYPLKRATAVTVPIFAHDANGDAVTGLLTGDWTKRISKNSGAFGAMTVTITEMEGGFYSVIMDSGHSDTEGILTCYFTHPSCEQVNIQFRIDPRLPTDLAFPSVSGRSLDVNSAGEIGIDLDNTSGTLVKGVDITGFNDIALTSIADSVWTWSTGAAITTSLVSIAANALSAVSSASLALTAYDPPTNAEIIAALAALNDITVAEVWAQVADGSLDALDALKYLIAYISGVVVKASTAFTYYSQTSVALWTSNITSADRRPI